MKYVTNITYDKYVTTITYDVVKSVTAKEIKDNPKKYRNYYCVIDKGDIPALVKDLYWYIVDCCKHNKKIMLLDVYSEENKLVK